MTDLGGFHALSHLCGHRPASPDLAHSAQLHPLAARCALPAPHASRQLRASRTFPQERYLIVDLDLHQDLPTEPRKLSTEVS